MAKEENKQLIEEKNIHLWFSGSPIAICTMKLELDTSAGCIFAYSKMMNVQPEHIKEVVFDLICYDSVRIVVDTIEDCKYSYLDIPRNGVFGMERAIKVKNPQTRNVEFVLKSVETTAGDVWENEGGIRFNISLEQESIYNVQKDLHKQFIDNCTRKNIDHTKLIFQPVFDKTHWLCACGTLNWNDEDECSGCKLSKQWLLENIQTDYLRSQDEKRKSEAEKVRREAAEKEIADKERQKKEFEKRSQDYKKQLKKQESSKRRGKFLIIVLVVTVLFGGGFAFFFYGLPYLNYTDAVNMMNRGDFDNAIAKFEKMNGYADSEELRKQCIYNKATNYFYRGSMAPAADLFSTIKGFKDSDQKYIESKMGLAAGYMEDKEFENAFNVYKELGLNEKDSEEMKKCVTQIYYLGLEKLNKNHPDKALVYFQLIPGFKKSDENAKECKYRLAGNAYNALKYKESLRIYNEIKGYKDVNKILNKLSNLALIINTAKPDGTPAVWEAYKVKCPKCGKEAKYVFEFRHDGRYKLTVVCENEKEPYEMTGKYKMENNKVYFSEYVSGISTWDEKATVSKVDKNSKEVEGKNSLIIMTDPVNSDNKGNIKLYGNWIEEEVKPEKTE